MKYKKITHPSDLKLEGVDIKTVMVGTEFISAEMTDKTGRKILFAKGSYSSFDVMTPAPPETVKKFRVSASVAAIPVTQDFESEYEAQDKKRELDRVADDATMVPVEVEIPF